VHNISLKIENDGAEKLWSYILAYREMMHKGNEDQKNNLTFNVPSLNQIKIIRNKKRA